MVRRRSANRGQGHPPTVRETAVPELFDAPASQHLFQEVVGLPDIKIETPPGRVSDNRLFMRRRPAARDLINRPLPGLRAVDGLLAANRRKLRSS